LTTLNKLNRILHRDFGYFFFGMTIIYAVSGIVLNHKSGSGDASIVTRYQPFTVNAPIPKETVDKAYVLKLLADLEEPGFKQYYFPSPGEVMIYLNGGHISLDLQSGEGEIVKVRNRPVFREFNFLHYNKPKQLWTWFSDIFAGSLILISVTGLFIIKGRNGIRKRGAVLSLAGIAVPLVFLVLYLWAG
jgi:uncharacterized protein